MSRLSPAVFMLLGLICACPPPAKEEGSPGQAPFPAPAISLKEAARQAGGAAHPDARPAYPMFPDHHSQMVVFGAEGDLWEVPARGGLARRLTTHEGNEIFPRFSPDGKHLAFCGDYGGNQDVFVMPAAGGEPRRLTFHPAADQVIGWTPDSQAVLFRSRRDHPHGDWNLWTIPLKGGDPSPLPLFRASRLSYEPGGGRVAINRVNRDFRHWKRYAGGTAAQIFVGDLQGGPFRKLTTFKGTNAYPMWHGGRIYFLSDRTGTMNIWSMSPEGSDLRQHTRFEDYDVRFPSLGQGMIAFQQRAEIHLLHLESGTVRPVRLTVLSDALRTRTSFTDPAKYLTRFELSPDGRRLGLQIRGDLHIMMAAKEGRRARISQGSTVREEGISFSDDGKEIATTSDASGETEVVIYDARGAKEPRQVTSGQNRFKYPPRWAPGGRLIAYADSENRLFVVPASGGEPEQVDHSPFGRIRDYSFSPDGRYLAYTKIEDNYFSSIFLYDSQLKKVVRVTDAYYNDDAPTWSSDGKYLAFFSERTINPQLDRLDTETILDRTTKPYLVLLSAKTRSPFLPRELWAEEEAPKEQGPKEKAPSAKEVPRPVKVELDSEGLTQRIIEVPVPAGNYDGLWAGERFLLYLSRPTMGMADWEEMFFEDKEVTRTLMRFDFEKKKAEPFLEEVVGYDVSRNGKTFLLRRPKGKLYAFELGPKPPEAKELEDKELPLAAIREEVNPRDEWRQIFNEVWRMMRDFYWTADMGKVDWKGVGEKYAALLPRVTTRDELEDLLGEMVAELSLGHTYVWGGDARRAAPVPVGLLGADLQPDPSGLYRFARIYGGETWDEKRSSPLALSHARVKEGDYLLKIDGRPVRAGENVYSYLQRAAGELVQITTAGDPQGRAAREVEITTLKSERALRYYEWVRHNRERVEQQTGGRVGYLHLPDMMTAGMVEFDRWFYPQVRKQGLIVDARWNRGGFISEILIKRLGRRVLAWERSRCGYVGTYPQNTLNGRLVVLTNELAGSDGDIFPRMVQVTKLGPVIGTRTWGGVVGINLANPLVDKGLSTRPHSAFFDLRRRWGIEGEGVQPDIVVDNDPGAESRGIDAQLERGIAVMLDLLKKNPPRPPRFTDAPDKSKGAWVKRYGQTDRP